MSGATRQWIAGKRMLADAPQVLVTKPLWEAMSLEAATGGGPLRSQRRGTSLLRPSSRRHGLWLQGTYQCLSTRPL